MEEHVVDPALAAAPAEIPIVKAESVPREVGKARLFFLVGKKTSGFGSPIEA